jgi:hypothetical protein
MQLLLKTFGPWQEPGHRVLPNELGTALTDAIWLVKKEVAVTKRLLGVLVDRNRDRLDVLYAMTFTCDPLAQLSERIEPRRVVRLSSYHCSCSRITNFGRQARAL